MLRLIIIICVQHVTFRPLRSNSFWIFTKIKPSTAFIYKIELNLKELFYAPAEFKEIKLHNMFHSCL